jgi:hypothetical protein
VWTGAGAHDGLTGTGVRAVLCRCYDPTAVSDVAVAIRGDRTRLILAVTEEEVLCQFARSATGWRHSPS